MRCAPASASGVKALRLINADLKKTEIDDRRELDDDGVIAVLTRMRKQRQDSLGHFTKAGREDLSAIERFEIAVIEEFLPQALSAAEGRGRNRLGHRRNRRGHDEGYGQGYGAPSSRALAGRADMAAVSRAVRDPTRRLIPRRPPAAREERGPQLNSPAPAVMRDTPAAVNYACRKWQE